MLLSETVMLVSLEHHEKAPSPMEVTEPGMVMLVRPEQFQKALPPMEVTFISSYSSGIIQTQFSRVESIGSIILTLTAIEYQKTM